MRRFSKFLALTCCFISAAVSADQVPAMGKLLVATDEVRGPYFAQTVILLLQHDETGSLGLVVNRPVEAAVAEAFREFEDLAAYRGTFYRGGPLWPSTLRALLRTDTPPEVAVHVFDTVHLVSMDEALLKATSYGGNLRFFAGHAGWAPGQLARELAFDSWHILPATEEVVFAEDTSDIWRKLIPPRTYQAAVEAHRSALKSTKFK